jgi:hypothetical protein
MSTAEIAIAPTTGGMAAGPAGRRGAVRVKKRILKSFLPPQV